MEQRDLLAEHRLGEHGPAVVGGEARERHRSRVARPADEQRERDDAADRGDPEEQALGSAAKIEAARGRVGEDEEQPRPVARHVDRPEDEPGERDAFPEPDPPPAAVQRARGEHDGRGDENDAESAEPERRPEPFA